MTDDNRKRNIAVEVTRAADAMRAAKALAGLGLGNDAVSRAYYSAFHYVRALLLSRGVEPKTHGGALHLLNVEFVRPGLLDTVHNRLLAGLERSRELADYDAAVTFSTVDADGEIAAAEQFIAAADGILAREGWR